MKRLLQHPLFLIGLVTRLALVVTVTPAPVTSWYVPFLDASLGRISLDPWAAWLAHGGNPAAFPYGYVMWLWCMPLIGVCKLVGLPLKIGYSLTLLGTDLALLALLRRLLTATDRMLLATYWLSPIVVAASYLLGFNDLVPVLLLTASLYAAKEHRLAAAGAMCAAAISAKLSMVLAVPFFLIYLLHNRALRQFLPDFVKGGVAGAAVLLLPFFAFSRAGTGMLFSNPEVGKVYLLTMGFGAGAVVYMVPLAYLLMLYATWRVRRLNFDLFHATLGIAFLLVVLMTPASPGWFIWSIPLLVTYQARSDRVAQWLVGLFSVLYVLSSVPTSTLLDITSGTFLPAASIGRFVSLLHTAMVAAGVVLCVRIWREFVSRNDYFRLSRRPFVIGIAGDSGAGKDTFSDSLKGLFGSHSVTTLSGDDYHLWDRQKPMWQVMTHLNPMANDLEGFANDLVALSDGRNIQSRHYDHKSGRMSRPFVIGSNDIIIASGLHALYLSILRDCYNLSVYLDIDEDLRRHFKLERDVHQRGHPLERVLASFERREPDAARFIRPQARYADIVLSLRPNHPRLLEPGNKGPMRFRLLARSRHGLNELLLRRVLVGICGLHVDMTSSADGSEIELKIEGDASAPDIAQAARVLCPRIFEFLDIRPEWKDGVSGLMQLVTLSHINRALTKRFIW